MISKTPDALSNYRILLGEYIRDNKIDQKEKLEAAINYLKTLPSQFVIDVKVFDEKCGNGVVCTEE